jgi:hypothetical protein
MIAADRLKQGFGLIVAVFPLGDFLQKCQLVLWKTKGAHDAHGHPLQFEHIGSDLDPAIRYKELD